MADSDQSSDRSGWITICKTRRFTDGMHGHDRGNSWCVYPARKLTEENVKKIFAESLADDGWNEVFSFDACVDVVPSIGRLADHGTPSAPLLCTDQTERRTVPKPCFFLSRSL